MATTGVEFVLQSKSATNISGATVKAAPYVLAMERNAALQLAGRVPGGAGSGILTATAHTNNGNFLLDGFASEGFAKNGCFHVTTSGTTAVNVDLTNLATGATTTAGDTVFATGNKIKFYNTGAADMTISPGASNPSNFPKFTGTTPTILLPAGSILTYEVPAGVTIDSTHKVVTITPTAGGDVLIGVGGA